MDDAKKLKNAQAVYGIICKALDDMGWKYKKEEEQLIVRFSATGNDLSTSFVIMADINRQLIRLMGYLPFEMSQDKRAEGSIATNFANYKFADGSFDYNLSTGAIYWRMTASFLESLIGTELVQYMIRCSCSTIDKYNDEFLAISTGQLSLADFIDKHSN